MRLPKETTNQKNTMRSTNVRVFQNDGEDNMNKKTMMTTIKQFLQMMTGLLGLLILLAVVKDFLVLNLSQHPAITVGLLALFGLSILLGSRERRDTLVHFVNQALNMEQLLMDDPEEENIMKQREEKLGEVGSMDLWQ